LKIEIKKAALGGQPFTTCNPNAEGIPIQPSQNVAGYYPRAPLIRAFDQADCKRVRTSWARSS